MTPAELSATVLTAIRTSVDAGELALPADVLASLEVVVERPKNREHGDYATNVALRLAKPSGLAPRDVAGLLAARLSQTAGIKSAEVAGPGFLNITFDAAVQGELARTVVLAGAAYGRTDTFAGQRIDLEFISANPTGPIHIGGVRWAAVGDSLARILRASGAEVVSEYYINDAGTQIDKFAASLHAAAHGRPVPEDGYVGQYIGDIARRIVAENTGVLALPEDEQLSASGRPA